MKNAIFALALSMTLAACSPSVKTSGGGGGPAPQNTNDGKPEADLVVGVKTDVLEGKWESGCAFVSAGKYVKLSYEFKANKGVIRGETLFATAACSQYTDFRTNGGTYRFINKFGGEIYEVEYKLMRGMEEGFQKHAENLQVVGNELFVSYGTSGAGVVPDIKLKRSAE